MCGHEEVESLSFWSMFPEQGEIMEKPSLDEVLLYARLAVRATISKKKKARSAPREQQDEMLQAAYERILEKYPEIEAESWKSYVYTHSRGAVLDYLKSGEGFAEKRWSLQKPEDVGNTHVGKINERVSLHNSAGEDVSLDQVVGQFGVFNELQLDRIKINWDLVSRMSSQDECLRAFAMHLRGITLDAMAPVFGVKVARAGQLVQAFVDRFDDPVHTDCPWFKQCCFALGLCDRLGVPNIDQSKIMGFSIGWGLPAVDLDFAPEPEESKQKSFFDKDKDGSEEETAI